MLFGVLLVNGYLFPSSNHAAEIPPILALFDPSLYNADFYVQEMLRMTPRFFYNYLIYFLASTGLGIPATYFVLFVVALATFLSGLHRIARHFDLTPVSEALFLFWAIAVQAGTIGAPSELGLWFQTPIPSAFAMSIAVWGVYCTLRKAWIRAFALFGITCLLQFLLGVLPALMAGPFLLVDTWQSKRWGRMVAAVSIFALGAGAVFVPMMLQDTTGTPLLDNHTFVELYAVIRHPHHLVPTAWPLSEWIVFLFFYLGGSLCLFKARQLAPMYRTAFLITIGMMLFGLAINYVFVEVWPLALVAKLQPARMTAFSELILLIGLSVLFNEQWRERRWLLCTVLAVAPISHHPGLLLFLVALFWPLLVHADSSLSKGKVSMAFLVAVVLYRFPLSFDPVLWAKHLVEGPVLLGVLLAPYLITKWVPRPRVHLWVGGLALLAGSVLLIAIEGWIPGKLGALVAAKVTTEGVWEGDLVVLARRFGQTSPKDALVLVPTSVHTFRLQAQRAVVVDEKAFPFTDRGMVEWRTRMEAITACDHRPACLLAVARRYRASYLLVHGEALPDTEEVDREGAWCLLRVPEVSQQ